MRREPEKWTNIGDDPHEGMRALMRFAVRGLQSSNIAYSPIWLGGAHDASGAGSLCS